MAGAESPYLLRFWTQLPSRDSSLDEQDLVGAYLVAYFSALDSELNMETPEGYDLPASIGVRLYANTRRTVDAAILPSGAQRQSGGTESAEDLEAVLS